METAALDLGQIEQAYARYSSHLRKIAYGVVKDHSAAEDCVHEVLLRVLARPACFAPERGHLKSFLSVCVRNEAVARIRRANRRQLIETTLLAAPAHETFEMRDYLEHAHLNRALQTLPGEQYAAISLFYFGSLSHPQISRVLGVPLGTVKTRIKLALKRLQSDHGLRRAS